MAKLISSSLPQNFVMARYLRSFVRTQAVCITDTRMDRPMVNGTIMKW